LLIKNSLVHPRIPRIIPRPNKPKNSCDICMLPACLRYRFRLQRQ